MKKLMLFAVAVMITVSCSSSDDSSDHTNNNSSKITPPTWIQGTWGREDVPNIGYVFYSDDLCQTVGGSQICQKEHINIYQGTGAHINVTQNISETEYKCSITIAMQTSTYHFQKLSPTTIKILQEPGVSGGNIILRKQ